MKNIPDIIETLAYIEIAHAGQVDKAGHPYTEHLIRVWKNFLGLADVYDLSPAEREAGAHAALLHDIIEDTDTTDAYLLSRGYSQRVVDLILGVSRPEGENRPSYQDWIVSLAATEDITMILIKLADNKDNSSPERIAQLPPEQQSISRRYAKARETLLKALSK